MNLFGINLGNADLWLLAIAGALSLVPLNVHVTAAIKRRYEVTAAYRLAFDDVILNLRENPDCPLAQIAQSAHPQHLAAITKFRPSVPVWSRKNFERSVDQYKDAHNNATGLGNPLALAASEKTDFALANRKFYSKAINRLLSYA